MSEANDSGLIESAATIIGAVATVLIPVVIVVVGEIFRRQRERFQAQEFIERKRAEAEGRELREKAEAQARDADRVAVLLKHLASDNPRERLLAVHLIANLRESGRFPDDLLEPMVFTAFSDRPDIAAVAKIVAGLGQEVPDTVVLLELLAPLVVHFDRTLQSFVRWRRQDLFIEEIIHESNQFVRDLLVSRSHLIPDDLLESASKLVDHYNAWLDRYDEVRPGGVRDPDEPFVFVGVPPINKPFPVDAERKFRDSYDQLLAARHAEALEG